MELFSASISYWLDTVVTVLQQIKRSKWQFMLAMVICKKNVWYLHGNESQTEFIPDNIHFKSISNRSSIPSSLCDINILTTQCVFIIKKLYILLIFFHTNRSQHILIFYWHVHMYYWSPLCMCCRWKRNMIGGFPISSTRPWGGLHCTAWCDLIQAADATKASYQTQLTAFLCFCTTYGYPPPPSL